MSAGIFISETEHLGLHRAVKNHLAVAYHIAARAGNIAVKVISQKGLQHGAVASGA